MDDGAGGRTAMTNPSRPCDREMRTLDDEETEEKDENLHEGLETAERLLF
jgi:hypothetical protein